MPPFCTTLACCPPHSGVLTASPPSSFCIFSGCARSGPTLSGAGGGVSLDCGMCMCYRYERGRGLRPNDRRLRRSGAGQRSGGAASAACLQLELGMLGSCGGASWSVSVWLDPSVPVSQLPASQRVPESDATSWHATGLPSISPDWSRVGASQSAIPYPVGCCQLVD